MNADSGFIIRSIVVLLLGLGVSVLTSIFVARRMVAPIRRLQASAARVGKGELDHRIDIRTGDELEALAAEGVQSLLLEGGPTLAAGFLEQGLVDKLLVFVAPTLSGEGPGMLSGLARPLELTRLESRAIGEDVLLQGYVNEP